MWLPGWEWGIACISFREDWSPWKSRFCMKWSHLAHSRRPLWAKVEMLLSSHWVQAHRRVIQIWCWIDLSFDTCDIFLSNRLLPPTSEDYYGRAVRTIEMSLEYVYRIGPENMCANFREIWTKSVGTGAKSVFWRKFKMAENLSRRKWAWPIWEDASWPKESKEKRILILRPTVRELWGKT